MQRLAFLLILLDLIRAEERGNCSYGGHVECCINFMLKNGRCVACPLGKFGKSCMEYCPYGFYGESCLNECHCSAGQICHYGIGCTESPERSKESFDACSQSKLRTGNRRCCVNQRKVGNECLECWNGKYGEYCKYTCPVGRYGRLCLETCNCTDNETCNRVTGCRENVTRSGQDLSLWMVFMGVSIGIIIAGLVVIFVLKRLSTRGKTDSKKRKDKRVPSKDEISTTTLATINTEHNRNPVVEVSNSPPMISTKGHTLGPGTCSTVKVSNPPHQMSTFKDQTSAPGTYSTLRNFSSSQDIKHTEQNRRSMPLSGLGGSSRHLRNGKTSTLPISGLKETRVPPNIQQRGPKESKPGEDRLQKKQLKPGEDRLQKKQLKPGEDKLQKKQSKHSKPEGERLTFEIDVESKKCNRSKCTTDNETRAMRGLEGFDSSKNETSKSCDELNSIRYSFVKPV